MGKRDRQERETDAQMEMKDRKSKEKERVREGGGQAFEVHWKKNKLEVGAMALRASQMWFNMA